MSSKVPNSAARIGSRNFQVIGLLDPLGICTSFPAGSCIMAANRSWCLASSRTLEGGPKGFVKHEGLTHSVAVKGSPETLNLEPFWDHFGTILGPV